MRRFHLIFGWVGIAYGIICLPTNVYMACFIIGLSMQLIDATLQENRTFAEADKKP